MVFKNPFGTWQVLLAALTAYMGAVLFGYDTGVAGGVISLESFQHDFGLIGDELKVANLKANVVSVLQAGCFFGAVFAAFFADYFPRRHVLAVAAIIFEIGAVLQVATTGSLPMIYAGRIISGLGLGVTTGVVPAFTAEVAPKEQRGRVMVLWQIMITVGVMMSYWVVYATNQNYDNRAAQQWRIPLAVQMIPSGLQFLLIYCIEESPRWLALKGKTPEALKALAHLRNKTQDDLDVLEELAEIQAQIEEENSKRSGLSFKECWEPANRTRFFIGAYLMIMQQWGGQNFINYYAPDVFKSLGYSSNTSAIFSSGVYGIVKFVATCLFCLFGIETIGRRWSMVGGGFFMGVLFWIVGAIGVSMDPTDPDTPGGAKKAMAAMIYLFVVVYSWSWGPVPWTYASEIFPSRIRTLGIGWTAAWQWAANLALSRTAPVASVNLGFKIYFVFAAINMFHNGVVAFFLKDTTGRSLESMDLLFKATTNEQREAGIAKAHNNLEGNTEKDPEAFDPKSKDAGTSGYVEYASQRA